MPRFSQAFELSNSSSELDFIDVELNGDTPLYLDPYAIELKSDDWSVRCADHIRSFFQRLLDQLRNDNVARAAHLLQNLHEPNETRLGESRGRPRGRAIGRKKAESLALAMRRSRAFETGVLSDVSEAELFVKYIGPDTISDLVTNVARGLLCEYTRTQCEIHNVPIRETRTLGPVWNCRTGDWEARPLELPVHNGMPTLLVPKFSVRRSLALNSQEFWNFHMTEFLQAEYLAAGGALVQVLKDGRRRVTKKDVQEIHPLIKDELAAFVLEHPEVLEDYKRIKGAEGPLNNRQLALVMETDDWDEAVLARVLVDRLARIPAGRASANEFHSVAMGICTFLFYPHLTCPIKEYEQYEGRKRIDIKYTNAATSGFFSRMLQFAGTRSHDVPVECKNYVKEIANPELDQLIGRFSIHRGRFGILLCRSMDDRDLFVQRCRDTVTADLGYIFVFEDSDLVQMLEMVEQSRRSAIGRFLDRRWEEIV